MIFSYVECVINECYDLKHLMFQYKDVSHYFNIENKREINSLKKVSIRNIIIGNVILKTNIRLRES